MSGLVLGAHLCAIIRDFRLKIQDLERRISTVVGEGFDDAVTVKNSFKLLDSFHGMIHRDTIKNDFDTKVVSC